MEKLFVPYRIAKELEKIGFKEPCFAQYSFVSGEVINNYGYFEHNGDNNAPMYQQVIDWFRVNHNIAIMIEIGTQEFSYKLFNLSVDRPLSGLESIGFNGNYYAALREAIEKSIKYIK